MKALLILLLLSSPLLFCRAATSTTVPKSTLADPVWPFAICPLADSEWPFANYPLATDALNYAVPPFGKGTEYYDWLNAEPERQICSKSTRKDFEKANPAVRSYFNLIENDVEIERFRAGPKEVDPDKRLASYHIALEIAVELAAVTPMCHLTFMLPKENVNWDCLLNLAAKNHGNIEVIRTILAHRELERDDKWYSPELPDGQALYNACSNGFADAARRIIGPTKEKERLKAFLIAVERQDTEVVKHFVEFGISRSLASIAEENGNLTMDQLAWLDTIPALVRQEFLQSIKVIDETIGYIPADWDNKQLYCKSLDLETRIEALELAVQYGKFYPIKQLLSGELNNSNVNWDRLIEIAAENHGIVEIIKILLDSRGTKPLPNGQALYNACFKKFPDAARLLIQSTEIEDRLPPFTVAASSNNEEILKHFIEFDFSESFQKFAKIKMLPEDRLRKLNDLVRKDFYKSIKELDERKIAVWDKQIYCFNFENPETWTTALEVAVEYGKAYPVELLLSRPQNEKVDFEPLINVAARNGDAKIIKLLLTARGKKPLTGGFRGALYRACFLNKSKNAWKHEAVILLIEPTVKKDRIATFVQAVKYRNEDIVRLFIAFDNGCVPNSGSDNRYIPLSTFITGKNGVYKDSRDEADKGLQRDSVEHLNEQDLTWLNNVNFDWLFWRVYKKHRKVTKYYESNKDRIQRVANDETISSQLKARTEEFLTEGPALYNACMQDFSKAKELLSEPFQEEKEPFNKEDQFKKKGGFGQAVGRIFGFGSQSRFKE